MRLVSALVLVSFLAGQSNLNQAQILDLPFEKVTRLPSPNGSLILYSQRGVNDWLQLWLEDTLSHQRQKLLDISDTLSAGWSIDGTSFYVQNHSSSSSTESYIYDVRSLKRVDLGDLIKKSDSTIRRFAAGHAYFDMGRWENPQTVVVHFYGHTDEPPVVCFDLHYRVDINGTVAKLERRVFPPDSKLCRG